MKYHSSKNEILRLISQECGLIVLTKPWTSILNAIFLAPSVSSNQKVIVE